MDGMFYEEKPLVLFIHPKCKSFDCEEYQHLKIMLDGFKVHIANSYNEVIEFLRKAAKEISFIIIPDSVPERVNTNPDRKNAHPERRNGHGLVEAHEIIDCLREFVQGTPYALFTNNQHLYKGTLGDKIDLIALDPKAAHKKEVAYTNRGIINQLMGNFPNLIEETLGAKRFEYSQIST